MLVVLDAGHGGHDPGAVSDNLNEKDLTLYLALKVKEYLDYNDSIQTLLTRSRDSYRSLEERVLLANENHADYFVSFHNNAGGGTGFESYIYLGLSQKNTGEMQHSIHRYLVRFYEHYGVLDRGEKEGNLYVLRHTNMPAILLENLFVDNPNDYTLLTDTTFLDELAKTISKSIEGILEKSF